jgi:hypothetical protein
MAISASDGLEAQLIWDIRYALHRAPVRALRRKLSDNDEQAIARAIAEHLRLANWIIQKGPPLAPHARRV